MHVIQAHHLKISKSFRTWDQQKVINYGMYFINKKCKKI